MEWEMRRAFGICVVGIHALPGYPLSPTKGVNRICAHQIKLIIE